MTDLRWALLVAILSMAGVGTIAWYADTDGTLVTR
jgi:hypothetical protein